MSNLIFSPYQLFAGPSNKTLYIENYPITTHSALLLGVAMTDQFLHVSFF